MRSGYKELTAPLVAWLNAERLRQDISIQKLAQQAKVNPGIAYKALTGKTAPEPETLERLARALGKALPKLAVADSPNEREQGAGGPGLPQDARSTPAPYRGEPASQRPRATVVSESVREKADRGNLTVAEEWDRLAKSVAERWHRIIVKHRIPFGDVLDLLQAEEDFLRERAKGRGSAGAHLLAAADDVAQLRESISQLPEPR